MNPITQLRIALLILVLAIGGGAVLAYNHAIKSAAKAKVELQAVKDENKELKDGLTAVQGQAARLDQAFTEKLKSESTIRTNRAAKAHQLETLKNEDQAVTDWADMPVPGRVRDIDRVSPTP